MTSDPRTGTDAREAVAQAIHDAACDPVVNTDCCAWIEDSEPAPAHDLPYALADAALAALAAVPAPTDEGRHEVRDNDRDAQWCSCGQAGCRRYLAAAVPATAPTGETETP